jgi:N-ethylmaleimide reductase
MAVADIEKTVGEYVSATRNALAAGFDGVELHGANGYLIEQFLNANVNQRTDGYGGSAVGRNRFALEIARATAAAVGKEKVGIRLSPYGAFNATGAFEGVDTQYEELARGLGTIGLAYVHLVDHSPMGAPEVPERIRATIRQAFAGPIILSGGYDRERAEADLAAKKADLIAFGRPFLANPDLVERLRRGSALNAPDQSTFYTPGPKGYTDYPTLA